MASEVLVEMRNSNIQHFTTIRAPGYSGNKKKKKKVNFALLCNFTIRRTEPTGVDISQDDYNYFNISKPEQQPPDKTEWATSITD